jgi:hypothetical protein
VHRRRFSNYLPIRRLGRKQRPCRFLGFQLQIWDVDLHKRRYQTVIKLNDREDGPSPRSCHKLCFDPKNKQIYTLGRYVDPESRPNMQLDSDFWRFDVQHGRWHQITSNTAVTSSKNRLKTVQCSFTIIRC